MPGAKGPRGATTSERYMRAFAASLAACSAQSQAYGRCLSSKLPDVERGCCEREFQALRQCFFAEFKARRKA